jgi:lincosamide nucleotidyltransferase A/C/D/E
MPLTRLNSTRDFDESLGRTRDSLCISAATATGRRGAGQTKVYQLMVRRILYCARSVNRPLTQCLLFIPWGATHAEPLLEGLGELVGEKQRGTRLRRLTVRAGRIVYPVIEGSPVGWLVHLPPLQWIKYRIIHTPAWRVLAVLDALTAADVRVWVAGGWGVDALLGRQTRQHCDIDLMIGNDGSSYQQVAQILAHEGFRFVIASHTPGIPIPWCHIWRHDAGHKVEVLPVPLDEPPFATDCADVGGVGQPFTEGSINGRPVPCLSAGLQLLLHTGYTQRKIDDHDVALLRAYLASRLGG